MDVNLNSKVYEGAKVIEVATFDQKESGTKVIAQAQSFILFTCNYYTLPPSAPTSPASTHLCNVRVVSRMSVALLHSLEP